MKILTKIASYVCALNLGAYIASQFKFDQPIELHRWIITSFFLVVMIILSNKK